MEIGSFWGVVMIVVGAAAAMIVARVARRPFRNRTDHSTVQREKSFLHRPLNLIALLVALAVFMLGLFWKVTGGGPN
ncbi:hypothetical protein ACTU44_13675 [Thalassospira sp. SM2505]|uniref:Uncharacterized protein n=1 Tax=Thalassospira profundimaris TaxID=502049 RepID=A0A367X0X0_9PROT|nr:hypothetical protein [Thalassospira profundimaris]RCK47323.1 hypothetical protein TH30_07555 [Thalassospira profundimaris]